MRFSRTHWSSDRACNSGGKRVRSPSERSPSRDRVLPAARGPTQSCRVESKAAVERRRRDVAASVIASVSCEVCQSPCPASHARGRWFRNQPAHHWKPPLPGGFLVRTTPPNFPRRPLWKRNEADVQLPMPNRFGSGSGKEARFGPATQRLALCMDSAGPDRVGP
jgi:hypothetical protein